MCKYSWCPIDRNEPAVEPDAISAGAGGHVPRDFGRGHPDPIHSDASRPAYSCAETGRTFTDAETRRRQSHQLPGGLCSDNRSSRSEFLVGYVLILQHFPSPPPPILTFCKDINVKEKVPRYQACIFDTSKSFSAFFSKFWLAWIPLDKVVEKFENFLYVQFCSLS